MKNQYVKPEMQMEFYSTNNCYAAKCENQTGVTYNFECNAGNKSSKYNVYLADGTPYCTSGTDRGGCQTDFYSYSPCGGKHEAESTSVFLNGYMYKQDYRGRDTGSRINVVIWTDNYTNVHCTDKLNQEEWEIVVPRS